MANSVFRQTLTAGVVLASAGAIALTPVTMTPEVRAVVDTPRVVTTAVMPAGLIQDLQLIANGARAAVGQSVDGLVRKVPDIWWTVEEQWPDADLTHWNYAMVANILFAPITPLVIGPLNDAVAEAVARNFPLIGDQIRQVPEFIEYAFIRLVGPLLSAIGGAGQAHSEIFYSMTTWRIEPFIEAIVKAPFHVIDGLLFGGYGDLGPILPGREGEYIPAPGLLTPWGQKPPIRNIKTPNDIVTTSVPDANATMVSLVTDLGEQIDGKTTPTAGTEIEVEPVTEPVTPETNIPADQVTPPATEGTEETATETDTVTEKPGTTAETTKPAKPAKVDLRDGIRQGIKDFRVNVRNAVKKLTGGGASSRPSPQSGGNTGGAVDSGSTNSGDSE